MSTNQQNPYIGPRTFQRNEGHLFFGRDREARDLISLVASERLVVFYAQSGAGKSSIVNTRLIPNLEEKEYEVLPVGRVSGDSAEGIEVKNIFIYNLLRSLEQHEVEPAVFAKLTLAQFLCQLNFDDKGFFYDANLPAVPSMGNEPVIRRALIIDQFEEIFSTHPEAWRKREDFFKQLALAMQDDPHLWVVLVMREDYIAALDPYAHIVHNGLRVRYYMQRLGREAALKAVKSPVESIRPFANNVAEKLIDDLCSITVQKPDGKFEIQPGQYVEPVQLQVVCYGLWENLSPNGIWITMKDLEDVGDVNQSLGKYYDRRVVEVARSKGVRERSIREWFEKKLITAGGIRNMVLQELETKPGELPDSVIQALQSDLVRAEKRGGATWYELTHDRLVEPILERNKAWFAENLSPLQRQAALWKDQDQNESWLLRDQALVEVEAWAQKHPDELTENEKEFLEACQKMQAQIEERNAAERQKLEMANQLAAEQARSAAQQARAAMIARRFSIASAFLVVIAIIASIYSVRASRIANAAAKEAQQQTNLARAGQLSTIALDKMDDQLDLAILLGLEADNIVSNSQTQNTLLALLQKSSRYLGSIKDAGDILQVQFSPDGKTFTTLDKNGITFWDSASIHQFKGAVPINGHFSGITSLALSQDGLYLAVGSADGIVTIWDADTLQMISEPVKTHDGQVDSLVFNTEGNLLAAASTLEPDIVLLEVEDPTKPQKYQEPLSKHTEGVIGLAFSPDGRMLASGSYDRTIILWDVDNDQPYGSPIQEHQDWVNDLAFTGDGTVLASASDDNRVVLWDIKDPVKPRKLSDTISNETFTYIHSVSISPDDQTLAMGTYDGIISLWNISNPSEPEMIGEPFTAETDINRLVFNPDGTILASNSYDGSFMLWSLKDVQQPRYLSEPKSSQSGYVYDFMFSLDGNKLIAGSSDSKIVSWDISNPQTPRVANAIQSKLTGQPTGMGFSADGRFLTSYGDDQNLIVDAVTQKLLGPGYLSTSPNGRFQVYQIKDPATGEDTIHLADAKTGEAKVESFAGLNPRFSTDESFLIYEAANQDPSETTFNILDLASAKLVGKDIPGFYLDSSREGQIVTYQTMDATTNETLLNVWDLASAQTTGSPLPGQFLDLSSDGRSLIYTTSDPNTNQVFLNVWDIPSQKNIFQNIEGDYLGFSSANQSLVYTSLNNETGESLINILNDANIASIETIQASIYSYATTQTGVVLVYITTNEGKSVANIRDLSTVDLPPYTFDLPAGDLNGMQFSQNGKILTYTVYDNSTGKYVSGLYNLATQTSIDNAVPGYLSATWEEAGFAIFEYTNNEEAKTFLIDALSGEKVVDVSGVSMGLLQKNQNPDGTILVYQTFETNVNNIKLLDINNKKNIGEPIQGDYMAISPNGETLVTRNADGAIVFWNVEKTWPLGEPVGGKNDNIFSAALSSDGKTLAWSGEDGIVLQNVASGTISSKPFNDHLGSGFSGYLFSFSPDGSILAVGDPNTSTTVLWDLAASKQIGKDLQGFLPSFSPDGSMLAIGDGTANTAILLDSNTLQQIGFEFPGYVTIFSPDSKLLAIGSGQERTTTVWDISSQQIRGDKISGPDAYFSPTGRVMAVIDWESSTTTLWDVSSMQQIGDGFAGTTISFSPDGNLFAIGNMATVTLLDLNTLQLVGNGFTGTNFSFSPDGKLLAIGDGSTSTTTLWDLNTLQPIEDEIPGYNIAFSPDGKLVAVSDGGTLTTTLWNVSTLQQIGDEFPGDYARFSTDSRTLALAHSSSNTVTAWDVSTLQQMGSELPGQNMSLSPDGNLVVVGDWNSNTTTLWDLSDRKSATQIKSGRPLQVTSLLFSSDGKMLASYAGDTILLRNLASNESLRLEPGDYTGQFTTRMSFYDDNRRFGMLGDDGTLLTWSVTSAKPDKIDPSFKDAATDTSIFSPDGKYLVYKNEQQLNIWDMQAGKPSTAQVRLPESQNTFGNLTFSPDGTVLAYTDGAKTTLYGFPELNVLGDLSAGKTVNVKLVMGDKGVRYVITLDESGNTQIWDWENRIKVGDPMSGNLQIVGSSPTDHTVVYIDSDGRIIRLRSQLEHTDWQKLLCPLAGRNFTEQEWNLYFPNKDYPSQEQLACPTEEIPSAAPTSDQQPTVTQTQELVQTAIPQTTATLPAVTATPLQIFSTSTPLGSASSSPGTDIDTLIKSAKILVYEDTVDEGLWIESMLKDSGYDQNATFVNDRLGDFKTQLTSTDTQWDLIIVITEAHGSISGGFWDLIKNHLDNGTPVILETRAIDRQVEGRIKPILESCGVDLQKNLELAVPLKWYVPDSPLLNTPNQVDVFAKMNRIWLKDAGDLLELTPNSTATILAGTSSDMVNSGVIVSCYDGRMILQTFSNHDYPQDQVSELWQNYVYNLLYERFSP